MEKYLRIPLYTANAFGFVDAESTSTNTYTLDPLIINGGSFFESYVEVGDNIYNITTDVLTTVTEVVSNNLLAIADPVVAEDDEYAITKKNQIYDADATFTTTASVGQRVFMPDSSSATVLEVIDDSRILLDSNAAAIPGVAQVYAVYPNAPSHDKLLSMRDIGQVLPGSDNIVVKYIDGGQSQSQITLGFLGATQQDLYDYADAIVGTVIEGWSRPGRLFEFSPYHICFQATLG
jgi:hypothetical protein